MMALWSAALSLMSRCDLIKTRPVIATVWRIFCTPMDNGFGYFTVHCFLLIGT